MSAVFLETSALLQVVFGESHAPQVRRTLARAVRVVASRLIRVEAERALIRPGLDRPDTQPLLPELERGLKLFWPKIDFIEISREICESAGRISPGSRLRTLDAIHLASYYRMKQIDTALEMIAFDDRIRTALGGG